MEFVANEEAQEAWANLTTDERHRIIQDWFNKAILVRAIRSVDECGALHIVVADGNVEDQHIESCMKSPDLTAEERDLAETLLKMPVEDREYVWYKAFAPH